MRLFRLKKSGYRITSYNVCYTKLLRVASGLQVQSITGKVGTSDLKYLAVYVTPNAGSAAIDLAEAKMFLTYDGKSQILIYNQTNANKTQDLTAGAADVFGAGIVGNTSANQMVVAVLQDYDNSVVDNGVINKGDRNNFV